MPRFSLLDIARFMAISAFLLLVLFRTRGQEQSVEMRFNSMPANDQSLEQWLHDHEWPNATVYRGEDAVLVETDSWLFEPRLLRPPWQELGYHSSGGGYRTHNTMSAHFFLDSFRYFIPFLLITYGLNKLKRRSAKPTDP